MRVDNAMIWLLAVGLVITWYCVIRYRTTVDRRHGVRLAMDHLDRLRAHRDELDQVLDTLDVTDTRTTAKDIAIVSDAVRAEIIRLDDRLAALEFGLSQQHASEMTVKSAKGNSPMSAE